MKVCSVVGARPQFVKAFPVSRAFRRNHDELLVHTGQHYEEVLSDVFFEELDIPPPEYNLGVGSGSHTAQTADVMSGVASVLADEEPDVLVLYGDTNSTLGAALVGAKTDVVTVHIEAGLRSGNREMPEEINRILTDHSSDLLCAPTDAAIENLEREGLGTRTQWTGDVMFDAMLWARDVAPRTSTALADIGIDPEEYVLGTVHRARNTDDPDRLRSIFDAFDRTDDTVVLPVHPRTEDCLRQFGLWERANEQVELIDPVGYLDFVALLASTRVVATDSGGVQKEAFFLDTPCVTLREETEWVETVTAGWNTLVGADHDDIARELANATVPDVKPQPYGDGNTADRICECVEEYVECGAETAHQD